MNERALLDPMPRSITGPQLQAANPASSIWVEANAGSGKTRVLTDRVLRLLLEGASPDQILCLTYTKAAAAEMRQRVSDRLALWALSDDVALARQLRELFDRHPDGRQLERARTLFAHALESPGGLKIQTIHAFCESVLHRFPVEAHVPFDFAVVDDHERETMILEARERVIASGINGDPRLAGPVETLFDELSDSSIARAIELCLNENRKLKHVLADRDGAKRRLRALVGMPPAETRRSIEAEIVGGYPFGATEHAAVLTAFPPKAGGSRFEDKLAELGLHSTDVATLLGIYLTLDGTVPKGFPKRDIVSALPWLAPRLLAEAERLAGLVSRLTRAALVERSEALLDVLGAISDRYEAEKRARALLDFDDLVEKLAALLADREQGQWVRYKLDGGISHVLVDESQDTNPEQWQVIDALVDEFFEAGGIERPHSLFAVGDGKQSIYSFQGAEPKLFRASGEKYRNRALIAERRFERVRLRTSFRTLPGVLRAVDIVFSDEARRVAVLEEITIVHETARRDPGGSVTLWTPVREEEESADAIWPLDIPKDTRSAARQVAERIAGEISQWIGTRRPLAARGRAVRPDDVLILVQSRSSLFHELIRSLHRAGLATPGADRLNVTSHIAVLDLMALADVLLNPADELQLAALLRSPLFAISEAELFAIGSERHGKPLWAALAEARSPGAAEAYRMLSGWRSRLDFERPYEFFARVLHADGGLRRLHTRMGGEVDDVIAEFLELALTHEQTPQPSLQGFLAAMRAREVTIKRELNERGGGVRVMTVHGAKGLEAPIVILADAASKPDSKQTSRPVYLELEAPGPLLVHASGKADHVSETLRFRDAEAARQQAEYWRKLYVAMTRAEDELYLTGVLSKQGKLDGTWYEAVELSLAPLGEVQTDAAGARRQVQFPRERPAPAEATEATTAGAARPAPLVLPPLPVPRLVPVIRPSLAGPAGDPQRALDTAAETLRDAETARREGIALHALLQHLPGIAPEDRFRVAPKALAVLLPEAPQRHEALASKAVSILTRPELAELFGAGSRAEVPFLVEVLKNGEDATLAGRIDRIVTVPGTVLIVDFKSDAEATMDPKLVKPAYLAQLGLYALAAQQLFPGQRIEAGILWTGLESLLKLPNAALAEAARGFTIR